MALPELSLLLLAFLAGAAVAGLVALVRSRDLAARRVAAETELAVERSGRRALEEELRRVREQKDAAEQKLAALGERVGQVNRLMEEQRTFLEHSRKEMGDAFQALAASVLRGSREEFLRLADRDLEERRKGIDNLLAPLRETLGRLELRTGEIEKAREGAYRGLEEQLKGLREATSSLQERTTTLASALKGSQVRGRWGEIALKNVVELAGMTEHVDFVEQKAVADGKIPDMVVRLPGERFIAVDSKVPYGAYVEATEATDEEGRERAMDRHVAALREHIRTLASRDYAHAVEGDVDLVVLFLPADSFLAAAFAREPELQNQALRARVLLATPTTLLALLRTVAIYWQQKALAENAERIAEVARDLYERAALFGEHLAKVGKGLAGAVHAFNQAAGSFEGRLLPMGRRLEELKVSEALKRSLEAPGVVEESPRELASPAAAPQSPSPELAPPSSEPGGSPREEPRLAGGPAQEG